MAGLLKAALALDRGVVPPTIHCETPNPKIPFGELNLRLVRDAGTEPGPGYAYAGVNSFGFGGTNAHVVLAAPPRREEAVASAGIDAPSGDLGPDRSIAARAGSELVRRALRDAGRAGANAAARRRARARSASAKARRARPGPGGRRRNAGADILE